MVAKRHHYLPQCYLKGFSKPKKRGKVQAVQVYDRNGKTFNTNIINIATEKDFNRIDIVGYRPDAFEQDVAKFESELGPALTRVIESKSLANEEDKLLLLNLVAAATIRVPKLRETIRDFHERLAYKVLEVATATPERWEVQKRQMAEKGIVLADLPYEKVRKSILDRSFQLSLATEWHIDLEMTGMDAILPTLMERKWRLLVAPPTAPGFITSDYPAVLKFAQPVTPAPAFVGPGHGMPGTEVVFPLSNKIAAVGTFEGKDETTTVDSHTVARLNGAMVAYCDRQIYAPDTDFAYIRAHGEEPRRGPSVLNDIHFVKNSKKA